MYITEFKNLYFTDFNISNLLAINKSVENNQIFTVYDDTRTTSVFVHLLDCDIKYYFEDGSEMTAEKGSIVYIPHNAKYRVNYRSVSGKTALAQLTAFEMYDSKGQKFTASDRIISVCDAKNNIFAERFDEAVKICDAPVVSSIALKSVMYSIIADISKQCSVNKQYMREFYSIAPSVEFLKNNPYSDFTVKQLASLSHISESCFRRIFKKQFGMSPLDYINGRKLYKAKELLQNSSCSVAEIAAMLGYSESAYFSKVFKNACGISPLRYRNSFSI